MIGNGAHMLAYGVCFIVPGFWSGLQEKGFVPVEGVSLRHSFGRRVAEVIALLHQGKDPFSSCFSQADP